MGVDRSRHLSQGLINTFTRSELELARAGMPISAFCPSRSDFAIDFGGYSHPGSNLLRPSNSHPYRLNASLPSVEGSGGVG